MNQSFDKFTNPGARRRNEGSPHPTLVGARGHKFRGNAQRCQYFKIQANTIVGLKIIDRLRSSPFSSTISYAHFTKNVRKGGRAADNVLLPVDSTLPRAKERINVE